MLKPQSSGEEKQVKRPLKIKDLLPWITGFLLFFSIGACVEWLLFEYRQERAALVNAVTASCLDGMVVKSISEPTPKIWPWILRILGWVFAVLFSIMAVALRTLSQRLVNQALYDGLTGLPSRYLFFDRLKQVIRRTKRSQGNFSILFIKLNKFNSIIEDQGVKTGDILLKGIGKRLIAFIRNCDTVTRWEGGDFLILLEDCPQDQANTVAENLCHQIELPVYSGEQKLSVSASIGIATFPDDGYSLSALLKVAGIKMVASD